MTTLLPTPAAWPRPLLGEAPAGDPADLDAAVRGGAFAGLARALNDLGATLTTADGRELIDFVCTWGPAIH